MRTDLVSVLITSTLLIQEQCLQTPTGFTVCWTFHKMTILLRKICVIFAQIFFLRSFAHLLRIFYESFTHEAQ